MVLGILTFLNLAGVIMLKSLEFNVAELYWFTTLLTDLPQQVFILPTLVLLIWALARKKWKLLAVNAAGAAYVCFTLLGFSLPLHRSQAPSGPHGQVVKAASSGPTLTIMSYNVRHFSTGTAPIIQVVRRVNPDILCLQEASPPPDASAGVPPASSSDLPAPLLQLREALSSSPSPAGVPRGTGNWQVVRHRELAILSRYPILSYESRAMPAPLGRSILLAKVSVKGTPLDVFNLHQETAAYAESLRRHTTTWSAYLRRTGDVRLIQFWTLSDWAASVWGNLVVCGDLNTPPRGLLYQEMNRWFLDSFREAGWGFGYTYNSSLPLKRIDYIYVSPGTRVIKCFVPPTRASDHLPVAAKLQIAP